MLRLQENLSFKPKCRVQLHVHLEGAIRHETIWEVMKKKGLRLPGDGSLRALKDSLTVQEPKDLKNFLQKFRIFMPAFIGDLEVIERIAFEFVEDLHKNSVAYCEVRLAPFDFLCSQNIPTREENLETVEDEVATTNGDLKDTTAESVVEAVLKGFSAAEESYDTKVRLILFCYYPGHMKLWETLNLCEKYKEKGIVGIDFACYETILSENGAEGPEGSELLEVFRAAQEKGIRRSIHAGEAGDGKSVEQALSLLCAERIGHGYRTIESEEVYQKLLKEGMHFEMCPHSSYVTGAIKSLQTDSKRHPILRMTEDGASVSISTDCPTITGVQLENEYDLLRSWGFTEAHFTRSNFEAALHSFLPPEEKKELVSLLKKSFGVLDYNIPSIHSTPSASSPSETLEKRNTKIRKPEIKIATWQDRST